MLATGALLPQDASDPVEYCQRSADLFCITGGLAPPQCSAAMWLAPSVRKRPAPSSTEAQPIWWMGGTWHTLPGPGPHPTYTPRRFEPQARGGLLRFIEAPMEAGPGEGHSKQYSSKSSGVVRLLGVLMVERDGVLWARPQLGSEWRECPFAITGLNLANAKAFELCEGEKYVVFFPTSDTCEHGLSQVLLFDARLNRWSPPVGASRGGVGAGRPPVEFRPVPGGAAKPAPLNAWLIESTPEYVLLISPVARDGAQRGQTGAHSAVHFIGLNAELVSHHLHCNPERLTIQRYADHFLFAKDANVHPAEGPDDCLDDDWQPGYPEIAGWLWAVEDIAVPPLEIMLPAERLTWGHSPTDWSLIVARGAVEELAQSHHQKFDAAPRLYLVDPQFRLWASRRVDDAYHTLYQRTAFDGPSLVRHGFSFELMEQDEVVGPEGNWDLWSLDLMWAARIDTRGASARFRFWQCPVAFDTEITDAKSLHKTAYSSMMTTVPTVSPVEAHAVPGIWVGSALPADLANPRVASGLPCYPAHHWHEGDFHNTEDVWRHPVGRDAAQLCPSSVSWKT